MTPARHIPLDGAFNLRDVGGYPAASGVTRWHTLYRSDSLHQLSDADRAQLERRGIRLVIDLRDDEERLAFPGSLAGVSARIEHNPVFSTPASSFIARDATLDDLYDDMIDNSGDRIASAVRLIADSEGTPVLVHCTAGKDRTGLVIAFALIAAGVDRAAVIEDYAETENHLPAALLDTIIERLRAHHVPDSVHLDELVRLSPATALDRILRRLEHEFGSVSGFLREHGVTDDELTRLERALVEPDAGREHVSPR